MSHKSETTVAVAAQLLLVWNVPDNKRVTWLRKMRQIRNDLPVKAENQPAHKHVPHHTIRCLFPTPVTPRRHFFWGEGSFNFCLSFFSTARWRPSRQEGGDQKQDPGDREDGPCLLCAQVGNTRPPQPPHPLPNPPRKFC